VVEAKAQTTGTEIEPNSQPEGLREGLWDSGTPSGCVRSYAAYRRSPLRFDLRLLSNNPAGCRPGFQSCRARGDW